jgi:hypothetical protein
VGHYVCLSWLPTYYNQEFGVDVQQSALLSVLPWCVGRVRVRGWLTGDNSLRHCAAPCALRRPCCVLQLHLTPALGTHRFVTVLASNSSGWIADGLSNSGTLTMTQTRKLLQAIGSIGPGEAWVLCCTQCHAWKHTACLSSSTHKRHPCPPLTVCRLPCSAAPCVSALACTAICLLYLANAHSQPGSLGMGEAVALLTATLSIGGFQSAGFASNHQVRAGVCCALGGGCSP